VKLAGLEHVRTVEDLATLPVSWRVGLASTAIRHAPGLTVEQRAELLALAIWPQT
jgi:hypothetical protein